ncbi:hypothetical protein EAH87_10965 [Sphingomonas koreensis]|nr:hypothetical protein EAH87_10965 [Sphingomonas koreensis]
MFAYPPRRRLILPLAPAIGGGAGLLVALLIALAPGALLDRLVDASQIPAVIAAAAPPLGGTARAVLVIFGGGGLALLAGLASWLVVGSRAVALGRPVAPIGDGDSVPVLRRADSHPDAPARRPVFAGRDLGTPLLDVAVPEPAVDLPVDLGVTLAAYDPAAIPEAPREPVRPVASLVKFARPQLIDPGDRFESFDPGALIEPGATIHALLDRLERGVSRPDRQTPTPIRPSPAAADGLQQALGTLRRLAAG